MRKPKHTDVPSKRMTSKFAKEAEESSNEEPAQPITASEFQQWKRPLSTDQLVTALSFRPQVIGKMSLKVSNPIKPKPLKRKIQASSLGELDKLPPEILHCILFMTDIRSIARITRVSVLGQRIVDTFPPYQQLMLHARSALSALGATGLASQHTVGALHSALHTPRTCVSCFETAPFLLMPTLERCCYECLVRNPALHCMPAHLAGEAFGLDENQVASLATVHTIGDYDYPLATNQYGRNRIGLVNMRAAKSLGLLIHGTMEELRRQMPKRPWKMKGLLSYGHEAAYADWLTMRRAQNAPLQPIGRNPSALRLRGQYIESEDDIPCDKWNEEHYEAVFHGMATVIFPSLQSIERSEQLHWCRGCAFIYNHWDGDEFRDYYSERKPPRLSLQDSPFILGRARRAFGKDEFIQHLRRCLGARLQIAGLAKPSTRIAKREILGRQMIDETIGRPKG